MMMTTMLMMTRLMGKSVEILKNSKHSTCLFDFLSMKILIVTSPSLNNQRKRFKQSLILVPDNFLSIPLEQGSVYVPI